MVPRAEKELEARDFSSIIHSNGGMEKGECLVDIDEKQQIINAIGEWGTWQFRRCAVIILIIWLPASFHLLNMIYYTDPTDYNCKRPDDWMNVSVEEWKKLTHKIKSVENNVTTYDSCWFKHPDSGPESDYEPCTEFEYDTSFWEKTIIMDFNLVCEREGYKKFTQQMTFFGLMCGVFSSGLISDRFGRRQTMLGLLLLTVVAGTISSFSPNYFVFLISVWLCGFASIGYGTVMYCWMMEHIAGKYKTILGACPHYCFGFWGLMTCLICYLRPNWRHLQLIFSVPCILLVGAYFYLPESARWLLANGKKKEAEDLCREIARENGRELDKDFELIAPARTGSSQEGTGYLGFLQLFRYPHLRLKTIICYYLWFSTALVYYGLTLNSNDLGVSIFVYSAIGKALEFPSITIVILMLLKTGRRITLMIFYTLGGVCLMMTMFVPLNTFPYEWPIVVLNLAGRVFSIGTLAVCYIYSSEIFPTVVRNVGLGSSSLWARVGPMVAPFVASLKVYDDRIPTTVFGVIALIAAVLVTFLPETSSTLLPDTIQDSEELGKGDTFWNIFKKKKEPVKK